MDKGETVCDLNTRLARYAASKTISDGNIDFTVLNEEVHPGVTYQAPAAIYSINLPSSSFNLLSLVPCERHMILNREGVLLEGRQRYWCVSCRTYIEDL